MQDYYAIVQSERLIIVIVGKQSHFQSVDANVHLQERSSIFLKEIAMLPRTIAIAFLFCFLQHSRSRRNARLSDLARPVYRRAFCRWLLAAAVGNQPHRPRFPIAFQQCEETGRIENFKVAGGLSDKAVAGRGGFQRQRRLESHRRRRLLPGRQARSEIGKISRRSRQLLRRRPGERRLSLHAIGRAGDGERSQQRSAAAPTRTAGTTSTRPIKCTTPATCTKRPWRIFWPRASGAFWTWP